MFNQVNTVMQSHCRPHELATGPICVYKWGRESLIVDFFCGGGGGWGWGVIQREISKFGIS